jgi:hypothetical protein
MIVGKSFVLPEYLESSIQDLRSACGGDPLPPNLPGDVLFVALF